MKRREATAGIVTGITIIATAIGAIVTTTAATGGRTSTSPRAGIVTIITAIGVTTIGGIGVSR